MSISRKEFNELYGRKETHMTLLMDAFKRFEKDKNGKDFLEQMYAFDDPDASTYTLIPIFLQYIILGHASKHIDKAELERYIEYKGQAIVRSAELLLRRHFKKEREEHLKRMKKAEKKGGAGKWFFFLLVVGFFIFLRAQR